MIFMGERYYPHVDFSLRVGLVFGTIQMMNKITVIIIIVALVIITGGYWYFNTINSVPAEQEQVYVPATNTNESGTSTNKPVTVPSKSSQNNTAQKNGVSGNVKIPQPPALPN